MIQPHVSHYDDWKKMTDISDDDFEAIRKEMNEAGLSKQLSMLELQDGGKFVLAVFSIDGHTDSYEIESIISAARGILKKYAPIRSDDYSWMVNIQIGNKVVESSMGGCPDKLPEL